MIVRQRKNTKKNDGQIKEERKNGMTKRMMERRKNVLKKTDKKGWKEG